MVQGAPITPQDDFNEITQLIAAARQRAVQTVNTTLIELCDWGQVWNVEFTRGNCKTSREVCCTWELNPESLQYVNN